MSDLLTQQNYNAGRYANYQFWDAIMVKETSNKDVRTAFANILEGKDN